MFKEAMQDLRGSEVLARDGRIGAVDDLYFDAEAWQVRYLAVATAGGVNSPRLLISAACIAAHDRVPGRLLLDLRLSGR